MTSLSVHELVVEREAFRLGPVSLELASGSFTALVGPSGAGKSTLLRCLAGLDAPASGEVRLDGEPVSTGRKILVPPEARRIGFVFQRGGLWPHMSALRHVLFAAPELGREGALALLERVGLGPELADRRPDQLSGGEAQRLGLARALAPGPRLLLLDEPLGSVDVHLRGELALLLRKLAREEGLTSVVVTHDREEALAMADDVAVLEGGRLMEHGSAAELLRRPRWAFTAAFLGGARRFRAEEGANGTLTTVLGEVPRPAGEGPFALVLLPGDLETGSGAAGAAEGPTALVLHSEPTPRGYRVHAELDGQPVEVASEEPIEPGTRVPVRLSVAPRVLPEHDGARR